MGAARLQAFVKGRGCGEVRTRRLLSKAFARGPGGWSSRPLHTHRGRCVASPSKRPPTCMRSAGERNTWISWKPSWASAAPAVEGARSSCMSQGMHVAASYMLSFTCPQLLQGKEVGMSRAHGLWGGVCWGMRGPSRHAHPSTQAAVQAACRLHTPAPTHNKTSHTPWAGCTQLRQQPRPQGRLCSARVAACPPLAAAAAAAAR